MTMEAFNISTLGKNIPDKVNVARNAGNSFKEVFEKITGGKIAEEIRNSYDITLHIDSTVDCQKLLDENDLSGTNHVIISPEALSKMENDPALKKNVVGKIEEFCSPESQKEISALSPPVKSAGMIIYPDGTMLYWLEGYPNEAGTEKDKNAVTEMSINKLLQKYGDPDYQGMENNLESIMQIMATGSISKR